MQETKNSALQPGLPPPLMDPVHWPIPGKIIQLERK